MIRGIHHIALNTDNLGRLLAFYRDVIGFEVVMDDFVVQDQPLMDELIGLEGVRARHAMLRAGNAYLELWEYSSPKARDTQPLRPCDRGYTHLCLDVIDIQAEYERLSAAGMKFNRRPEASVPGVCAFIYGNDPDGNVVELQELLDVNHEIAMKPRLMV
jgi:glyoxylase I family protein